MPARRDHGQREAWQDELDRLMRLEGSGERAIERFNAERVWAPGDEAVLRYIRHLLDRATGQSREGAKQFLREIPPIVEAGPAPSDWHKMVETEYPQFVGLLDEVSRFDVHGHPRKPVQSGHNSALTDEQCRLVLDHLPLVRRLARKRCTNDLAATLDHELFAELERIGLQVLEEQIRRWDRTGRVAFGAFAMRRVAGAMDNYLTRERIQTTSLPIEAEVPADPEELPATSASAAA